jgi:hypothetical protein
MSKLPNLPVYAFTVHTRDQYADGTFKVTTGAITASYFQEQGQYTVFKDTEHAVVEAYRTDLVTRIVRTEKPVAV